MIIIIKFKKYIISTYIFGIIMNKLYYKKKLYLVILCKINKNLEISLYYIIFLFNLAIYL